MNRTWEPRALKLAASACVAALIAVTGVAPSAAASGPAGPIGAVPQVFLPLPGAALPASSLGSGNLVNHGGHPESGTVTNYVIYWGLPSESLAAPAHDANPYAAHIDEFLHDVSCRGRPALAGTLSPY